MINFNKYIEKAKKDFICDFISEVIELLGSPDGDPTRDYTETLGTVRGACGCRKEGWRLEIEVWSSEIFILATVANDLYSQEWLYKHEIANHPEEIAAWFVANGVSNNRGNKNVSSK